MEPNSITSISSVIPVPTDTLKKQKIATLNCANASHKVLIFDLFKIVASFLSTFDCITFFRTTKVWNQLSKDKRLWTPEFWKICKCISERAIFSHQLSEEYFREHVRCLNFGFDKVIMLIDNRFQVTLFSKWKKNQYYRMDRAYYQYDKILHHNDKHCVIMDRTSGYSIYFFNFLWTRGTNVVNILPPLGVAPVSAYKISSGFNTWSGSVIILSNGDFRFYTLDGKIDVWKQNIALIPREEPSSFIRSSFKFGKYIIVNLHREKKPSPDGHGQESEQKVTIQETIHDSMHMIKIANFERESTEEIAPEIDLDPKFTYKVQNNQLYGISLGVIRRLEWKDDKFIILWEKDLIIGEYSLVIKSIKHNRILLHDQHKILNDIILDATTGEILAKPDSNHKVRILDENVFGYVRGQQIVIQYIARKGFLTLHLTAKRLDMERAPGEKILDYGYFSEGLSVLAINKKEDRYRSILFRNVKS